MKKLFAFTMMIAFAILGFSQEYIQQPTAITTWDYGSASGEERPYTKNITLEYDGRGHLSFYRQVINYSTGSYQLAYWYTNDALNRLTFKQYSSTENSWWETYRYYYTYDESSNLTERLVKRKNRYDMYFSDEFVIDSKDVYQYEHDKKVRWNHLIDSTFRLQYYYLYEYSDNDDWSAETKYNAAGQPLVKSEYTYSDIHDLLSKAAFSWSEETETWINTALTEYEYEYDEGVLVEKRITSWSDESVNRQRQIYDYDESGNCTQILFQTMMDSVYVDQKKAVYVYDDNSLCTNAYAQRWNDTAWVVGGFPSGTYLFFDDLYDDINGAMGSLSGCTRAEVTGCVTTPNPQYVLTLLDFEGEWYYEILNDDGSITYQYLQCAGDTTINNERAKIVVRTNQIYDKKGQVETSREYLFEREGIVYWWNEELQEFTVLYNFAAEVGDEWEIKVGTESIVMHVDDVEFYEYEGRQFKMLQVSDAENLFSGTIVRGIGHLTSFFPERLMNQDKGYHVEGIRCFWQNGILVFKYGEKACDEVYETFHDYSVDDHTGSEGFSIFPNPTDGLLHVETRRATSLPMEYRITNLLGQTMLSGVLEGQIIDVSKLTNGVYFLIINSSTDRQTIGNRVVKLLISK